MKKLETCTKLNKIRAIVVIQMASLCFLVTSCSSVRTYDARLSGYKYPFEVKNFKLKTQNQSLEMSYMDLNQQSKNVVVLLHGKNFAGFYWKRIAQDLMRRGYRVIIPDQIGFGKSSKPKNYQYSFSQLALNTKKLLESLEVKKISIVGHSMGGMLAVIFADNFKNSVNQVILINPIGLEDYGRYVQFKDPSFFYTIELNKTAEKIKEYQKKNYYDGSWKPEYEDLVTPFAKQIDGPDWKLVAWNNALTYGPIFTENIIDKLERTQVPISILLGIRDRTGPGRKWKKEGVNYQLGQYQLMKSRLVKLSDKIHIKNLNDLGHLPHFEDYERFSKSFYLNFPQIKSP